MTSPIHSQSTPSTPSEQSLNVPIVAQQMQKHIGDLSQQFNELLHNPSKSQDPQFLSGVATTVSSLNQLVNQTLTMGS